MCPSPVILLEFCNTLYFYAFALFFFSGCSFKVQHRNPFSLTNLSWLTLFHLFIALWIFSPFWYIISQLLYIILSCTWLYVHYFVLEVGFCVCVCFVLDPQPLALKVQWLCSFPGVKILAKAGDFSSLDLIFCVEYFLFTLQDWLFTLFLPYFVPKGP